MSELEFQAKVLSELQALRTTDDELSKRIVAVAQDLRDLKVETNAYQKGSEAMVRMATTIIIAAASVVVLSNLSPAITALVTAIAHQGGQ